MALVMLEDVQEGQVLVEDVMDKQARVLLKAGVELNAKQIRMLKSWGVVHVMVEGDDEQLVAVVEYPEKIVSEAKQHAATFFKNSNIEHPVMSFLHKVWLERHLQELVKKES